MLGPAAFGPGRESFSVEGVKEALSGAARRARVRADDQTFEAIVRVDTPQEVEYYRFGGILPYVLRQIAEAPVGV